MNNQSKYRVEEFNNGTLFAVVSDEEKHSDYYKTRKGAEKMLAKVRHWAGETN